MKVVTSLVCGSLLTACAVGWAGNAGEKLRLSGNRTPKEAKESARFFREKLKSRQLGVTREASRPSLQGVTTSPFQLPSSPLPRILSKDELRRLQDKKNWIFQDSTEEPLSEKNLYRALGIRDPGGAKDSADALTDDSSATAMERYVERRQQESLDVATAPPPQIKPLSRRNNAATLLLDNGNAGITPEMPGLALTGGEHESNGRFPGEQIVLSKTPGDSLRPFGGSGSSLVHADWGTRSPSLLNVRGKTKLSGVASLLGSSPIKSAIGSIDTPLNAPIGGIVTDPINAFPDLTRQEINPVTASGLGQSATKSIFPDPQTGKGQVVQLRDTSRPSVIDTLTPPSRSYLPPVTGRGSSLDPKFSPSKTVHTHLEIPRRTF